MLHDAVYLLVFALVIPALVIFLVVALAFFSRHGDGVRLYSDRLVTIDNLVVEGGGRVVSMLLGGTWRDQ